MRMCEFWQLSVRNVCSTPVKSLLTTLGMAIGIGAVLAVITLGKAGQSQVRMEMQRLGIDKVWITANGQEELIKGDAQLLAQQMGATATEQIYMPLVVTSACEQISATVAGISPQYLLTGGIKLSRGRMLLPLEWNEDSRFALMGKSLAQKLVVRPGDRIHLAGRNFDVTGIVEPGEGVGAADVSECVFVPLESLCVLTKRAVHEITLLVAQEQNAQNAAFEAERLLSLYRGTDVDTLTMQLQKDAADSVLNTFVQVLGWVAVICVLTGGIGIMNILLVGVRERRREIGIMKSLGTGRRQICSLFLTEALLYAVTGGGVGVLLGIMLVWAAGSAIGVAAAVGVGESMAVFAAGLGVGLFFGVIPAYSACSLKPVDALKQE